MKLKDKYQVGQKIWWVPRDDRRDARGGWVTIVKVGAVWITLSNNTRCDGELTGENTGRGYGVSGYGYLTKEEHDTQVQRRRTWDSFCRVIRNDLPYSMPDGVTIEDIVLVRKILKLDSDKDKADG